MRGPARAGSEAGTEYGERLVRETSCDFLVADRWYFISLLSSENSAATTTAMTRAPQQAVPEAAL
jgi:hypothetical protein